MEPGTDTYEPLMKQAAELTLAGRLIQALEIYSRVLAWAKSHGEPWQEQRSACSRAAMLIELGEAGAVMNDLRQILLQSADAETAFLASYTLSRAYDLEGNHQKSVLYARSAIRHAQASGRSDQLGASHNLLGSLLLAQSDFEAALEEFERALAVMPTEPSAKRASCLDNRGYCYIACSQLRKGFRDLFASIRMSRRVGALVFEADARLSLAYTYLQEGLFKRALHHARRSLALAEGAGQRSTLKYGLFVLGEAEKLAGNPFAARQHFYRLQEEFYPEAPNVPDLLLFLNVQSVVNIKA